MRNLLWPFLIFFLACGSKADQPEKKITDNDLLVTLDGIGPIKTFMSQEQLEKTLGKKIPLTNLRDTVSGSWMDSAFIKYKEADIRLTFERSFDEHDNTFMRMTTIETSSPLCKTIEGVGIGSSKQEIIKAFPGNRLSMNHGFEKDTDTIPAKSLYVITVRQNREGPQIIFYLKNNKVRSIEVGSYYDDEE
jgi:hypothetical protein